MINIPPLDLLVCVMLFGPSVLSLAFTLMARKFVQNASLRKVCMVIAFVLLVVQGRWLLKAMVGLLKYRDDSSAVLFTIAGSIGFIVAAAFLVKYFLRAAKPGGRNEGTGEIPPVKRP